jgi:hypothetical protein
MSSGKSDSCGIKRMQQQIESRNETDTIDLKKDLVLQSRLDDDKESVASETPIMQ